MIAIILSRWIPLIPVWSRLTVVLLLHLKLFPKLGVPMPEGCNDIPDFVTYFYFFL
jgi:hypothetical protein